MLDKKIQPLGDRVVLEKPDSETLSASKKILITDAVGRGKAVWGEVIAVGEGIYTQTGDVIPMNVKVGDEVLYKKDMVGDTLEVDGKEYIVFREHDLIMVKRHIPNELNTPTSLLKD